VVRRTAELAEPVADKRAELLERRRSHFRDAVNERAAEDEQDLPTGRPVNVNERKKACFDKIFNLCI
jgi:hypothetical protein